MTSLCPADQHSAPDTLHPRKRGRKDGRFRAKLVEHDLWELLLGEVNRQLEAKQSSAAISSADLPLPSSSRMVMVSASIGRSDQASSPLVTRCPVWVSSSKYRPPAASATPRPLSSGAMRMFVTGWLAAPSARRIASISLSVPEAHRITSASSSAKPNSRRISTCMVSARRSRIPSASSSPASSDHVPGRSLIPPVKGGSARCTSRPRPAMPCVRSWRRGPCWCGCAAISRTRSAAC